MFCYRKFTYYFKKYSGLGLEEIGKSITCNEDEVTLLDIGCNVGVNIRKRPLSLSEDYLQYFKSNEFSRLVDGGLCGNVA